MAHSSQDTRPCPYCGESIKANAIKCRFCGEFLDGGREPAPAASEPSTAAKWLMPVGRTIWAVLAGWFGLISLVPFPLLAFVWFPEGHTELKRTVIYLCAGVNGLLGLLAVVLGIGAAIIILQGGKGGIFRSIFAIVAGLVGSIGNLLIAIWIVQNLIG